MNTIALQRTVVDLVAEYEAKDSAIPAEIEAFNSAVARIGSASSVFGQFGGSIWDRSSPSVTERTLRHVLLVSAWKAIYSRLQIDRLATAKDKKLWEQTIANPPPLTIDNAVATFGDYLLNARFHVLRGLAETFASLDDAYKSHEKVRIGVKGLPKRIIVGGVSAYGSWGRDRIRDTLSALAVYRGENVVTSEELRPLDEFSGWRGGSGEVTIRGLKIKKFENGNAHIIFDPAALRDINQGLAEFYGEVLPDAEGEEPGQPATSTAVAKDLQYYPTPAAVIAEVLDAVGLYAPERYRERPAYKVLEPSCGDGRMMDEIRKRGHQVFGFEIHAGRAAEARAKGHPVVTGNFLEAAPVPEFDFVVMNPPFYGRHYLHHVRHAMKFLKPGGTLVSILPAAAYYDHGNLPAQGRWSDLPVASFAESGTNIPTGYLVCRA